MPTFTGTNREFKRYVGPRLRNLVQAITRKQKAAVGACEHCGAGEDLEAAHVRGRDRNQIIDLLMGAKSPEGLYVVDLEQFEKAFRSEHEPVEKAILILCRDCHNKYDAASRQLPSHGTRALVAEQPRSPQYRAADVLPITLDPPRVTTFKDQLLIHHGAEITTYYDDGRIERSPWNTSRFSESSNVMRNLRSRPEFRQGTWQAEGIVKVHVSVVASDA